MTKLEAILVVSISQQQMLLICLVHSTHFPDELSTLFIERVKHPRIEDIPTSWHTWREIVCFHDRMVGGIKFEDDDIPDMGRNAAG